MVLFRQTHFQRSYPQVSAKNSLRQNRKSDTTILKYYLWYVWPFWTIQYNLLLLGYGSDNNKMWIRYIMVTGFNALSLAFA